MAPAKKDSSSKVVIDEKLLKLLPGYDPFRDAKDCWFDEKAAKRPIEFFHECLQHIEGDVAGKPFILEPWQQCYVANLFGWKTKNTQGNEVRRYKQTLLYLPRKSGKAESLDNDILTVNGWKKFGDLVVGDEVFGSDGKPTRILYVTDTQYRKTCYRVVFSDGCSAVYDADHLWVVFDSKSRTTTLTTKAISETLLVERKDGIREYRYRVPVASPLQFEKKQYSIDPYVLGYWLGDGCSRDANIGVSLKDYSSIDRIVSKGYTITNIHVDDRSFRTEPFYRVSFSGLRLELSKLGLLNNKHIPEDYLRGSIEQRYELLRGLMDSDGCCQNSGACVFTNTNQRIIDGVIGLLRSLNYKVSVSAKHDGHQKHKICYAITFFPNTAIKVFSLARKAEKQTVAKKVTRSIVAAVKLQYSPPVRCIKVEAEDSLYLSGKGLVPTHNTPLAAGISLYCLFCDKEPGAQIYCAAADINQASLVFRHARSMIEAEEVLRTRVDIYKSHKAVVLKDDPATSYRVISSSADQKHGLNPHLVLIDELHAQPNRELVDTLTTAMSSLGRRQSLLVFITTADYYRESICNEKYEYACKVRDGLGDPTFLPAIYETLPNEDWTDEKVWAKANPNLNVSVSLDYLRQECKKAQEIPSYENAYKRLHLNLRTETDKRWLPSGLWDQGGLSVDHEQLVGREAFAGIDFGWRDDFSALVYVFPIRGKYYVIPHFWIPAEGKRKLDDEPLASYIRKKLVRVTPGDTTDIEAIYSQIKADSRKFHISKIAIDPNNARKQALDLQNEGYEVIDFAQTKKNYNEPCRHLEALLHEGRLIHDNHAVLRWMAANVTIEENSLGEIMPKKIKSADKIDGICALLMALSICPPESELEQDVTIEVW